MTKKTGDNIHKHHRDRLKKRFLSEGLKGFNDSQALELLLFYAYPQKDTNPIAHEFLNKYGSLSNLFEADYKDLQRVLGSTEHVAVLLTLIPQLYQKYMISKWSDRPKLSTVREAGEYCVSLYQGKKYEVLALLCFDLNKHLIATSYINEGIVTETIISPRKIVECAIRFQAVSVIMAHNHPGGTPEPSFADIEATRRISELLAGIGISLSDHIIISGNEFFSFAQEKMLD
jgi:DNA repair protein RadC